MEREAQRQVQYLHEELKKTQLQIPKNVVATTTPRNSNVVQLENDLQLLKSEVLTQKEKNERL